MLAAQTLAGSELGFMGDAVAGAQSSLCEEKEIASNKEPVDRALEVKRINPGVLPGPR